MYSVPLNQQSPRAPLTHITQVGCFFVNSLKGSDNPGLAAGGSIDLRRCLATFSLLRSAKANLLVCCFELTDLATLHQGTGVGAITAI